MKRLIFILLVVFLTFPLLPPPQNINAEEIKLVTYYPSPSGAYTKLAVGSNTPVPGDYNAAAGKYSIINIGTKINEAQGIATTGESGVLQVGGTINFPCTIYAVIPAASGTAVYGWGGPTSGSFMGWSGTFTGGYGCWIDHLYISSLLTINTGAKIEAGGTTGAVCSIYAKAPSSAGAYAVYGDGGSSGWSGVFTGGTGAWIDKLYNGSYIYTYGYIQTSAAHPGSPGKHLYDIAEDVSAPECESGDVVIIDPDHDTQVIKTATRYSPAVAGIISETPVFHIGKTEGFKPLALAGRVKTNVTTANGPIKRGDMLVTSSKPGYAMKADLRKVKYGMVIGKALGELKSGEGKIEVLVTGH